MRSSQSFSLVDTRLKKIIDRSKVNFLNEYTLHQLYCAGGTYNNDFLQLLSDNEAWFEYYFNNKHKFFLSCNLLHACMIGNLKLVQFLVEKKGCKLKGIHTNAAAASGELELLKYLIEEKKCHVIKELSQNIIYEAVISGNVDVLKYVIEKFNLHPAEKNFSTSICSGSLEMVKFLYETYHFSSEGIRSFHIENSRNLAIIEYLLDTVKWLPKGHLYNNLYRGECHASGAEEITEAAYRMGMIDVVKYIEKKFPYKVDKSTTLEYAIESGDLETINHLLNILGVTKENTKNEGISIRNDQYFLLMSLKSGNLDVVKLLTKDLGLVPVRGDLLDYAIESSNLEVIRYLINEYGYQVTNEAFKKACHTNNLEVISFCYNACKEILPEDINWFASFESSLLLVYHLIKKENYQPEQKMLDSAFFGYRWHKGQDSIADFMEYLINVHHLKPTEEMISLMQEKQDKKMLSLFQQEKCESFSDDESEEERKISECSII